MADIVAGRPTLALLLLLARLAASAFAPSELKAPYTLKGFDASAAKPPSLTWRQWCDPPSADEMNVPLSNRSLRLQRDTPWLQMRADTLDTLEFTVTEHAPNLWRQGSQLLDVGAASGELTRFIARKYGLQARALDVLAPENNSFATATQRVGAWPVEVFDGARLPARDGSYDVVLFVYSLHHASTQAPALLREAARVARSTIVVVEACDVLDEATDASGRRAASSVRAREFACMGDRRAIFRTQREWVALLEASAGWRVTKVGAVHEREEPPPPADAPPPASAASGASSGGGGGGGAGAEQLDPAGAHEYRRFFVARRSSRS